MSSLVVQHLLHPLDEGVEPEHARLGVLLHKVGVLDTVAGVGEVEAHPVGRVEVDGLLQGQEVTRRLAHLLPVSGEGQV